MTTCTFADNVKQSRSHRARGSEGGAVLAEGAILWVEVFMKSNKITQHTDHLRIDYLDHLDPDLRFYVAQDL